MKKLEASAIYYALFLSIIFALILGGLILFSGFNQNFAMQMDIEEILIDNAKSGITYGQVYFKDLKDNEPELIRLYGSGIDSVEVSRKQWGAFTIVKSKSIHRNRNHQKVALLGESGCDKLSNLYLVDFGRPLSVCGDTRIEGNCAISKAGVKRAYIEGENYQGHKMIYGTTTNSEKQLPQVRLDFLKDFTKINADLKQWEEGQTDSILVSFADKAIHYVQDGFMVIDQITINGQVMLEASDSIFIGRNAQIENAIVKSPVVYVESGFSGTVQIFATERIVLEDQVQLKYPSILALTEKEYATENAVEIVIGEQSQVIGTVFLISEKPNFRKQPLLTISEKSELDGFVYCQGKTQLKGTVNGHLYTQKFYLKTVASAYENHLLDGQILDQLPEGFIVANLFEETSALTRLTWLN